MIYPRLVLICCEGKTEKIYFDIIVDVFRGPFHIDVKVCGEKGQHKALIDYAASLRNHEMEARELEFEEIVVWAVCDDDKMSFSYNELNQYAENKGVFLAFSRPMFEAYLMQHFGQSKECDQQALFSALSKYRKHYGSEGKYNSATKADLAWLERAVREKPKLVDIAITNSSIRSAQTSNPFLTVQKLTAFIKSMEID